MKEGDIFFSDDEMLVRIKMLCLDHSWAEAPGDMTKEVITQNSDALYVDIIHRGPAFHRDLFRRLMIQGLDQLTFVPRLKRRSFIDIYQEMAG